MLALIRPLGSSTCVRAARVAARQPFGDDAAARLRRRDSLGVEHAGDGDREAKNKPWKPWIKFDVEHQAEDDVLNRERFFFWHVDAKGRLWRRMLHTGTANHGEMRHAAVKNRILAAVQRNEAAATRPYRSRGYHHVSIVAHEHYFISAELSPIVFHDVVDGELVYAAGNTLQLDRSKLRAWLDGGDGADACLVYPFPITSRLATDTRPLWGVVDASLTATMVRDVSDDGSALVLTLPGSDEDVHCPIVAPERDAW